MKDNKLHSDEQLEKLKLETKKKFLENEIYDILFDYSVELEKYNLTIKENSIYNTAAILFLDGFVNIQERLLEFLGKSQEEIKSLTKIERNLTANYLSKNKEVYNFAKKFMSFVKKSDSGLKNLVIKAFIIIKLSEENNTEWEKILNNLNMQDFYEVLKDKKVNKELYSNLEKSWKIALDSIMKEWKVTEKSEEKLNEKAFGIFSILNKKYNYGL